MTADPIEGWGFRGHDTAVAAGHGPPVWAPFECQGSPHACNSVPSASPYGNRSLPTVGRAPDPNIDAGEPQLPSSSH